MKINLTEKCPKCGCQDKTIERKIQDEHLAFATTGTVVCSKCGYVFTTTGESKENDESKARIHFIKHAVENENQDVKIKSLCPLSFYKPIYFYKTSNLNEWANFFQLF